MTSERDTQSRILTEIPDANTRLWRLPVGSYAIATTRGKPLPPGEYRLADGRTIYVGRITVGTAGMSDLIGLRSVVVTPDMVGRRLAVFSAVEVKSDRGKLTAEQFAFISVIRSLGGRAGEARSVEEARGILIGEEL